MLCMIKEAGVVITDFLVEREWRLGSESVVLSYNLTHPKCRWKQGGVEGSSVQQGCHATGSRKFSEDRHTSGWIDFIHS